MSEEDIGVIKGVNSEKERIRIILEYISNKNSHPRQKGGVDYKQFFEDIQDLEMSLTD